MPRPKKKQSIRQHNRGSEPVARTYAKDAAAIIPAVSLRQSGLGVQQRQMLDVRSSALDTSALPLIR